MGFLSSLMSLTYRAMHGIPGANPVLNRFANVWPYKSDVFVAGGFFVYPPPRLPTELPGKPPKIDVTLNLLVLRCYVEVPGVVKYVESRPKNAEWDHETFGLTPDDLGVLNAYNLAGVYGHGPALECEPPVGAVLPGVGQRVAVRGALVINLANGWCEIHPSTSWSALP